MDWGEAFSKLSATYGFRPIDISVMTYPQVTMYLEAIPNRAMESEIQMAQLLAMVANLGRGSGGEALQPKDFLGGYARSFVPSRYDPHVQRALRWAARKKIFNQKALDLVDWEHV